MREAEPRHIGYWVLTNLKATEHRGADKPQRELEKPGIVDKEMNRNQSQY